MDLTTSLRTAYTVGNYQLASSSSTSTAIPKTTEFLVLKWKSILRATGDVSQAAQALISISASFAKPPSELLKKALILWSKALKYQSHGTVVSSPSSLSSVNSEVAALQEVGTKAYEAAELEVEEREQIILLAAEGILLVSSTATKESFSLLKFVKASNLDCQVMFIEILIRLGQFQLARDRLKKMKNIPEWSDDVRFLLTEATLALSAHGNEDEEIENKEIDHPFTIKDALYSYQELIQVHGNTVKLTCGLSATYALLSKFNEAQNNLFSVALTERDKDVIVQANLVTLSSFTSDVFSENLK